MSEGLPERRRRVRQGWSLCLSGGGFRAALYHLGALRRLDELGLLGRLDQISSVSGGSILAAFLARQLVPWPAAGTRTLAWEAQIAAPFRRFCATDLRTPALLHALRNPLRMVRDGFDSAVLERAYRDGLHPGTLAELPERPRFVFCATEMSSGTAWRFERDRVGCWKTGMTKPLPSDTVARAVAASSCFPPVFAPIDPGWPAERMKRVRGQVPRLRLTDGGVYDNLGLEPAIKQSAVILVSDGGSPFDFVAANGLLRTALRLPSLLMRQVAALRRRQFESLKTDGRIEGAFWRLNDCFDREVTGARGRYSLRFVDEVVAKIRTDLDSFTTTEARVLENHGYWCATKALEAEALPDLAPGPPPSAPHPDLCDEQELRRRLASERRGLLAALVAALTERNGEASGR